MKAKLMLCLFCLATLCIQAQSKQIYGSVIDKSTGRPLPFATIIIAESEKGTSADVNGNFSIQITKKEEGLELFVSNIGYKKKKITVPDAGEITVELSRLIEELNEVSILRPKANKKHRINSFRLGQKIGIGNFSGGKYPSMVARYYKRPEGFASQCFLNEIKIKFFAIPQQPYKSAKFRLRILAVDSNGKPGKDLVFKDLVLEKPGVRNSLKVDVSNFYIQVPKEGFFIALEHLFINENAYKEVHNYRVNDTVYKDAGMIKYAPVFEGILEENNDDFNSYYLSVTGWRKMNKLNVEKFGGEVPAPAFLLKFTD